MLKIALALLLVVAAWGIGAEKGLRLRRRARRLETLSDGLLAMEGEIRACLSPIPDALTSAGRFDSLFGEAGRLSTKTEATSAFLEALKNADLEKEEQEVLSLFAQGLGSTDETGQLQNLSAARKRIDALERTAQNDFLRLGKLYPRGGAMVGLLIAILLL